MDNASAFMEKTRNKESANGEETVEKGGPRGPGIQWRKDGDAWGEKWVCQYASKFRVVARAHAHWNSSKVKAE
jgi:hypothetical protein